MDDGRVAEIPVLDFLEELVPGPAFKHPDDIEAECYKVFNHYGYKKGKKGHIQKEEELYPKLCHIVQMVLDRAHEHWGRHKLLAKDIANWPEDGNERRKVDCGIYRASDYRAYTLTEKEKKEKLDECYEFAARNSFTHLVLPCEFKIDEDAEGFGTGPELHLPQGKSAQKTRGQIVEYAAELMARQHRTHLYLVYIYRDYARLFYFDHVSTVMSERFDYVRYPANLLEFFYRIGSMSFAELGYDPTITLATTEEIDMMRKCASALDPSDYRKAYIDHAMQNALDYGDKAKWPIYKALVPPKNIEQDGPQAFLIGRPRSCGSSLLGRATKGFVAFNLQTHTFMFLKDSWRTTNSRSEVVMYERLKSVSPYIATLHCGGDLSPEQVTQSQSFHQDIGFISRIHHRLVIEEIGRPLAEYENPYELTFVVYCAFLAHQAAWLEGGILHRDISDNNVLIVYNDRGEAFGMLIDWDLSRFADELDKASDRNRSGTWRYLAALRLKYPMKCYQLADDIESFVHLISWFALKYHKHDLLTGPANTFATYVHSHFLDCHQEGGLYTGCGNKYTMMQYGVLGYELTQEKDLTELLQSLIKLCKEHYSTIDKEGMKKYAASKQDSDTTAVSPLLIRARRDIPRPQMGIHASTSQGSESSSSNIPPANSPASLSTVSRPTLDTHDLVLEEFFKAVQKDWKTYPKCDDQFLPLCSVNMTEGRSFIVGTTSQRSSKRKGSSDDQSSMKRQRSESGSRPITRSQAARGVGSGLHSVDEVA